MQASLSPLRIQYSMCLSSVINAFQEPESSPPVRTGHVAGSGGMAGDRSLSGTVVAANLHDSRPNAASVTTGRDGDVGGALRHAVSG
jgi:hypothetical protein